MASAKALWPACACCVQDILVLLVFTCVIQKFIKLSYKDVDLILSALCV